MSDLTDEQCVEICQRLPLGCAGFLSVEAIRYALAPMLTRAPSATSAGVDRVSTLPFLWRQREPDNGEELTEFDKGYDQASDECADSLEAALRSRVDEVARDAERYRWLKRQKTGYEMMEFIVMMRDVDQAIDNAIQSAARGDES